MFIFHFFFWPGSYLHFEGNTPAVTLNYIWHNCFSSHTSMTNSFKIIHNDVIYLNKRQEEKKPIDFFFRKVLLLLFSLIVTDYSFQLRPSVGPLSHESLLHYLLNACFICRLGPALFEGIWGARLLIPILNMNQHPGGRPPGFPASFLW